MAGDKALGQVTLELEFVFRLQYLDTILFSGFCCAYNLSSSPQQR